MTDERVYLTRAVGGAYLLVASDIALLCAIPFPVFGSSTPHVGNISFIIGPMSRQ